MPATAPFPGQAPVRSKFTEFANMAALLFDKIVVALCHVSSDIKEREADIMQALCGRRESFTYEQLQRVSETHIDLSKWVGDDDGDSEVAGALSTLRLLDQTIVGAVRDLAFEGHAAVKECVGLIIAGRQDRITDGLMANVCESLTAVRAAYPKEPDASAFALVSQYLSTMYKEPE